MGATLDSAHPIPKRRKRSRLSLNDCLLAFERFAKAVQRQAESSGGASFGEAPDGHIDVTFRIRGSYGAAEDLFEAVRVLGGYKLARDE